MPRLPAVSDLASRLRRAGEQARALPPLVIDTLIAVLCYIPTIATPAVDGEANWRTYSLAALASFPLIWRRRFPIITTTVVGVGTTLLSLADLVHEVPYGQLVATYTFAALSPPLLRVIGVLGTIVGVSISLAEPDVTWAPVGITLIAFGSAYALGAGTRARREWIDMLQARAHRLAQDYASAVSSERARLARDMHDIVAHSVSLMVVQAEAGPVVVRTDPDRAEAAFDAIAATGRDALAQLRRTLGVLRAGNAAARSPQPDLDALPALVDNTRRAGLETTMDEYGHRRALPPDVAVAAYRVIQESLTNTVKHARAQRVWIRLDWQKSTLHLEVSDDGRGSRQTANGGQGLVGMRERVTACGGTLHTGPGARGTGFRVAATLPLGAGVG